MLPSLATVNVFTWVQAAPLAIVLGLAIYWAVKDRSPAAPLFLFGGLLCALIEPIVDHNAKVMFPEVGVIVWRAYGVPQPLWLVIAYSWFFGGQSMILWRFARAARTPAQAMRTVLTGAVIIALVDTALQVAGLYLDLFSYGGKQPWLIGRFPLWAPILDCAIPVVYVTLCISLEDRMKYSRVLLAPCVQAGVNAGLSWPLYLVANGAVYGTEPSALFPYGGAAFLLASISFLTVAMCGSVLAKRTLRFKFSKQLLAEFGDRYEQLLGRLVRSGQTGEVEAEAVVNKEAP